MRLSNPSSRRSPWPLFQSALVRVLPLKLSELTSIECTIADGLARVVLNAPKCGNPIDGTTCRELREHAVDLSEHDDVRAVLLSARGKYFSVRGDIKSFARERSAIPSIVKNWTADLHSAIARLIRMRAPVVAAVHGNVAGGSVSLVASPTSCSPLVR
jgi:2-(1,2-epoxy-1,2-dihydrophenyl)acetyl-CoA isomerase